MSNFTDQIAALPAPFNLLDPILAAVILSLLFWVFVIILYNFSLVRILRTLTRRIHAEAIDMVVGILRRPGMILLAAIGLAATLRLLPLSDGLLAVLDKSLRTVVILLVLYVIGRLVKDVLIYYGKQWARKTESKVDDNLLPVLNIFTPLLIMIIGVFTIMPMWGLDVSSALVGAGVIGLVLGLALQDSLSNLFSGMSLVVEAAYRVGDLLQMPDGTVCEVEDFGLRTTRLYSLVNHCTLYMPNKLLAEAPIINVTQPSVEQRASIELSLTGQHDIRQAEERLRQIAGSIPGVLMWDLQEKITLIRARIVELEKRITESPADYASLPSLKLETDRLRKTVAKTTIERDFNQALRSFITSLKDLVELLHENEYQGFTELEKQNIHAHYIPPAQAAYQLVLQTSNKWMNIRDAYASEAEHETVLEIWKRRNARLSEAWGGLLKRMDRLDDPGDMRLDDQARALIKWISSDYRVLPEAWKDPKVIFKDFAGEAVNLQLWFYVDNIRMEKDERMQRVRTDLARQIKEAGF